MKLLRNPIALLWSLLCLTLCLQNASAAAKAEASFVCPIDAHGWKQMVDVSTSQFGTQLDLKPLGPDAGPWTLPQCPKCHFVIYQQDVEKIPSDKLKQFILSDTYQSLAATQSTYFCLGMISEFLAVPAQAIGGAYLAASWQATTPEQTRQALERALKFFKAALPAIKGDDGQLQTTSILCGEIERRLGLFAEARKRFESLAAQKAFKAPGVQAVIKRELEFIAKKDSGPHAANPEDEKLVIQP